MRSLVVVLALLPALVPAQPPQRSSGDRLDLRRVRLGTDTLEIELGAVALHRRVRLIDLLELGTGADTGRLRQVRVQTDLPDAALTSTDTIVADARTLALRQSVTIRQWRDGRILSHEVTAVVGGELVTSFPADSTKPAIRAPLLPGTVPLAMPTLLLRAAPLSRTWRGAFAFHLQAGSPPMHMRVDSVESVTEANRRVWLVSVSLDHGVRARYAIDSVTRDLVQFTVRDSTGALVSTARNQRYVRAPAPTTTAPTPADVRRVSGHYYLEGMREVGSELLLRPDGTFEFMLAYGALDELGRGTWRMAEGDVVLQSTGMRNAPGTRWFDAVRARVEPGVLVITIEDRALRYVRH